MVFSLYGRLPETQPGPLPFEADLVVIGGGVIGVCTALFAARSGMRVVLLEKGRIAAEQSSRNWGWVRVQGRDFAEIPIALEAQGLWQALDAECQGRLGVRRMGVSYVTRSKRELEGYMSWLHEARPMGVSTYLMGRKEALERLSGPQADWIGGIRTPTDLRAEPWVAVPELAQLAREAGVSIYENCAVRALDLEAGKVKGVVTEAGRLRASKVVLAGGAWSSLFLGNHGVRLPQLSVRASVMALQTPEMTRPEALAEGEVALRPRADGGLTVACPSFAELYLGPASLRHGLRFLPSAFSGDMEVRLRGPQPDGWPDAFSTPRRWSAEEQSPFERMRVLDPEPYGHALDRARSRFDTLYPKAGIVRETHRWAGMIDVMPDVVPVVDHVPDLPGLILCTGMSGHGFGIGPGFGRVVAAMAREESTGHDISRFRFARFTSRERLNRGPSI